MNDEPVRISICPPPCLDGKRCSEEWQDGKLIKHTCAHDFDSGPMEAVDCDEDGEEGGIVSATCKCGMTAYSHALRYAP